ncbi:Microfibrillar-associated protein 4, partial [Halocaridina rubra]
MWFTHLIIVLVVIQNISVCVEARKTGVRSTNLPFRYELEQVTTDFQERLRNELSKLEMEMYTEFLEFLQEIDGNQTTVTTELTDHLSEKVYIFLEKFTKVMVYSSERIENLKDAMSSLTTSLTAAAKENFKAFGKNNLLDTNGDDTANERSKRHTFVVNTQKTQAPSNDYPSTEETPEGANSENPPPADKPDFAYLGSTRYFDEHLGDHDANFLLRENFPDDAGQYLKSKEVPNERRDVLPRNCYDLLKTGFVESGVYIIYPSGKGPGIEVRCEQTLDGGGWTIVLRRNMQNPFLNFTRIPIQYVHGFGKASENYFMGLEEMHVLTQGISNSLRVHLNGNNDTNIFALYKHFSIGGAKDDYPLNVGDYDISSSAPDALTIHSGRRFSYPLPES